jgi:hypothetical protein
MTSSVMGSGLPSGKEHMTFLPPGSALLTAEAVLGVLGRRHGLEREPDVVCGGGGEQEGETDELQGDCGEDPGTLARAPPARPS